MTKNRKIHDWTTRLVEHLRRAGVRTSDPVLNRSKKGYYSAYFGVPGMGEVRISDHPLVRYTSTADISISGPPSYIDLAKAFVFKHNEIMGGDLTVIDRQPYIISAAAGAELLQSIELEGLEREAARAALEAEVARRREWWAKQIAKSGLDGSYKEVKYELKRRGLRYPGEAENEDGS